jgi:predicted Zn-dependent protease
MLIGSMATTSRPARFTSLACIVVLVLSTIQCGVNIFSDTDDIRLGQQLDQEIRKNPAEYPILTGHPEVKEYVVGVGGKILNSPEIKKKGIYAYQYEIIQDDKTVNAFCTPGGYIYVYTGLLKFVDNEATLAGIIVHEIAHAEMRHATTRMTKQYGMQYVLALVLGQNPSQIADVTANLFSGLALLANSRADETQSDECSIRYLTTSGYYPGAITFFFNKIQGQKGSGGGTLERLLSTHPLPQDRVDHVREILARMGNPVQNEGNLFADRYQAFKKRLP